MKSILHMTLKMYIIISFYSQFKNAIERYKNSKELNKNIQTLWKYYVPYKSPSALVWHTQTSKNVSQVNNGSREAERVASYECLLFLLKMFSIILNIYIYIYSSHPWKSNYRDDPMGHTNVEMNSSCQLLTITINFNNYSLISINTYYAYLNHLRQFTI